MRSIKISLSVALLISAAFLPINGNAVTVVEKDGNKNTHNEIDDGYNAKKGWSFYFDDKNDANLSKTKKTDRLIKKTELELLQKILDENKKQTKIQNKILALLQKQVDPKPKEITVNGKKCIANSSAQCFDYGSLIVAEAKKVPVLVKFLKDPYNVTNAAHYLQWQAKYLKHSINVGNSLQFAYAQFGEKAYPIGAQSTPYTLGFGGYEGKILPDAQDKLIISMKNKMSFKIFLGKNINLDIYSALAIVDIIKKYGEMNIEIVFFDKKSKSVFIGAVSSVYKLDKIRHWSSVKMIVQPKAFGEYGILTTPSYVVEYKNKNKKEVQTLLHGRVSLISFRQQTISFMELKKLIDYQKFTEQNNWKSKDGREEMKKYYKTQYNLKIDKALKKQGVDIEKSN
ncbi:hypothetical protein [Sulfurimonas sp.]